jgi:hypothetical protein
VVSCPRARMLCSRPQRRHSKMWSRRLSVTSGGRGTVDTVRRGDSFSHDVPPSHGGVIAYSCDAILPPDLRNVGKCAGSKRSGGVARTSLSYLSSAARTSTRAAGKTLDTRVPPSDSSHGSPTDGVTPTPPPQRASPEQLAHRQPQGR